MPTYSSGWDAIPARKLIAGKKYFVWSDNGGTIETFLGYGLDEHNIITEGPIPKLTDILDCCRFFFMYEEMEWPKDVYSGEKTAKVQNYNQYKINRNGLTDDRYWFRTYRVVIKEAIEKPDEVPPINYDI